jgi:uncharacterized protein YdhG (YjbR/CyaY superfamily)
MAIKDHRIDDYITKAPEIAGPILWKIRALALKLAPDAAETISYKLPAYKDGRVFFYFAAFKNHVGIYPPVTDDLALISDLAKFRGPKGNLQFPYGHDIPYDLIGRTIVALHRQYSLKK